jgi:hypothetical protein
MAIFVFKPALKFGDLQRIKKHNLEFSELLCKDWVS